MSRPYQFKDYLDTIDVEDKTSWVS